MRSDVLPRFNSAHLSDSPPREAAVPPGWPLRIVPNFSDWQLADVVLVENDGSATGNAIVASQLLSLAAATRAGSRYTHAALYIGSGRLIDATTADGIAERSVLDYCQTRALAVRRVPGLTQVEAGNIVLKARAHIGNHYSRFEVIRSKVIPRTEPHPERLYCSTFVGLVIAQGSGVTLASQTRYRPLHPGTLAEHDGLDIVQLEWRPV